MLTKYLLVGLLLMVVAASDNAADKEKNDAQLLAQLDADYEQSNQGYMDVSFFGKYVVGDYENGNIYRYTSKSSTQLKNVEKWDTGSDTWLSASLSWYAALSSETFSQHKLSVDLQGGSSSGDNARLKDWWMDYEMGIIYFNNSYPFFEWNAVKVSYIYGERYLEKAIEEVATKMVVIDLLMSDDRSVLLPEGTNNIDLSAKVQLLQSEIDRILPRYQEIVLFE